MRPWTRTGTGIVPVLLFVVALACSGEAAFQGTVLERDLAPAFRLKDQFGRSFALADTSGKVVALTFLYTNCPDVCPIVTANLHRAHLLLGDDASEVEFLAISVDPKRDSVEGAFEYSQEKDMLDRWRFLVGGEEELPPIWQAYWLAPVVGDNPRGHDHDDSGEDAGQGETDQIAGAGASEVAASPVSGGGYLVGHTAPVFLIDREGYRRVLFTNLSLEPQALAHDIRLLVNHDP